MINSNELVNRWRILKSLLVCAVLLLGLFKLIAALHHGKSNVWFLLLMMIGVVVGALLLFKGKKISAKGERYIEVLSITFQSKFRENKSTLPHYHMLLLAGIYGMHFLDETPHGYIERYVKVHGNTGSGTAGGCSAGMTCSAGSYCSGGSSCSGGGSCGGGCGGCGGCGS